MEQKTVADFWGIPMAVGIAAVVSGVALLLVTWGLAEQVKANPGNLSLVETGKVTQAAGWATTITGGALVVTGIIFAVWPKAPAAPVVAIGPGGSFIGFTGAF